MAALFMVAAGPLAEPQYVRFQIADGVQATGTMSSWDAEGFDGSLGRRLWTELNPRDTWRLYVRVMEPDNAGQWVDLGGVLLLVDGGQTWAERAFQRALGLDANVAADVEAARRVAKEQQLRQEEIREAAEAQRLAARSPEAADWPSVAWPPDTPAETQAAVATLRVEATQVLRRAGLHIEPLETDRFMVHADRSPLETARLAARLEAVYAYLADLFWLDDTDNRFWGKAVVLYLADPDRFRLMEAESFGQVVSRGMVGICHPAGPKVFINLTGDVESEAFRRALTHEVVHAFMHRYRTPSRPPPWANEGLALFVSAQFVPGTETDTERTRGVDFIRAGGDVTALLDATYETGWPGPRSAGPSVGALLVELMIEQRPAAFRRWLNAVKDGKDWSTALTEDYGTSPGRLLETFRQYYTVND